MVAVGAACLLLASTVGAQVPGYQVVVDINNPVAAVPREVLVDFFLKKASHWDNGETAHPVDLPADSEVRRLFSAHVLERSVAVVRAYWEQRIFSGRDLPPPELDTAEAVLRFVSKYPGAVGYVSASAKLDGVKAVAVR